MTGVTQFTEDPIRLSLATPGAETTPQEPVTNVIQNPFDYVIVSGKQNPGICKVSGGNRPFWVDVQHAPGSQGNIIWYRGWDKNEGIKLLFQFWQTGQVETFYRDYLPLWFNNSRPVGVNVEHPALNANEITKLMVKNVGQLTGDEKQMWSVQLDCIEYRKAKAIKSGAADGAKGPNYKPTAEDVLDEQILAAKAKGAKIGLDL